MNFLRNIFNYLAFYALWIICVLSASSKMPWLAISATLLYLALHLRFISSAPRREAVFIGALMVFGAVNESVFAALGVVTYAEAYWEGIAWWTVSLWGCFATTYWHAFSWLERRPGLAAVLGGFIAPLSYAWIERMGGVSFPQGETVGILVVGGLWAIVLPVSFVVSRRIRLLGSE